jgi:hypothetical protein
MLNYDPQPLEQLTKRYPAAVASVLDFTLPNPPIAGLLPEHVFDFQEGVRLIISIDRITIGRPGQNKEGHNKVLPTVNYLHVSGSCRPGSPFERRMLQVADLANPTTLKKLWQLECSAAFHSINPTWTAKPDVVQQDPPKWVAHFLYRIN